MRDLDGVHGGDRHNRVCGEVVVITSASYSERKLTSDAWRRACKGEASSCAQVAVLGFVAEDRMHSPSSPRELVHSRTHKLELHTHTSLGEELHHDAGSLLLCQLGLTVDHKLPRSKGVALLLPRLKKELHPGCGLLGRYSRRVVSGVFLIAAPIVRCNADGLSAWDFIQLLV
jgi:hypothetical protein